MAQTETTTRIKQVGTVIVPVTNQDRALEFYVGTLGFEKRTDMPFGDGDRWVEVAPPGAAMGPMSWWPGNVPTGSALGVTLALPLMVKSLWLLKLGEWSTVKVKPGCTNLTLSTLE